MRWRLLARDVVVAFGGFALVFALVFLAGRVFVADTGLDFAATIPPVTAAGPELTDQPSDSAEIMRAFDAKRTSVNGSAGVLFATGAFEGEFLLERAEILGDFCPECGAGVFGEVTRVETSLPMDWTSRRSVAVGWASVMAAFSLEVEE